MTTLDQVKDNIKTFSEGRPLTPDEQRIYESIVASHADLIPCTSCRYCCDECPQSIDIPKILQLFNECRFNLTRAKNTAWEAILPHNRPSDCIACGTCVGLCPQKINIPEALKEFQSILENLYSPNLVKVWKLAVQKGHYSLLPTHW
ncbi:MAG: 4Fe-4S dicluster domain-containing protein [Desulfovibrio sp.]|jgi:predicted aldo/keto reductase-like oxidoreductase|nr:4Fe-4S dicluster domain-containing protein [Desulfovibrio sp.]